MSDSAGLRYTVEITSGSSWRPVRSMGLALNMLSTATPTLQGRGKRLLLGTGGRSIVITDTITNVVVWKRPVAEFDTSAAVAPFIEQIRNDLEDLSVEAFKRRWKITE